MTRKEGRAGHDPPSGKCGMAGYAPLTRPTASRSGALLRVDVAQTTFHSRLFLGCRADF